MGYGRVLIVDDEPEVRTAVRLTLNKAGYEVVEAEDGGRGVEEITSGDNPVMIDAVVCDLNMPRMHGTKAIEYFRSQFPSVPIVVMTGHPSTDSASELFRKGIADYLIKPVHPQTLAAAVHRVAKDHVYKDPFVV